MTELLGAVRQGRDAGADDARHRRRRRACPDLLASRGLINDLGTLGSKTAPGAKALDKLLVTLRKTGGRDELYKTILNLGDTVNGYDSYGHFLRVVDPDQQLRRTCSRSANVRDASRVGRACRSRPRARPAPRSTSGEAAINANPKPRQLTSSLRRRRRLGRCNAVAVRRLTQKAPEAERGRARQAPGAGRQGPARLPDGERPVRRSSPCSRSSATRPWSARSPC